MTSFTDRDQSPGSGSLNPRSCAASSMTRMRIVNLTPHAMSQSAFMRGFIDDRSGTPPRRRKPRRSQSAFMRGFIDDRRLSRRLDGPGQSQSAFMRGFIDDAPRFPIFRFAAGSLNPRSCAASSMTARRGYAARAARSLNPRSCAASSMTGRTGDGERRRAIVSIRVHARLHR